MTRPLTRIDETMSAVDAFLTTPDIGERSRLAAVLAATMHQHGRDALGGWCEGYVQLVDGVVVRGPGSETSRNH